MKLGTVVFSSDLNKTGIVKELDGIYDWVLVSFLEGFDSWINPENLEVIK